MKFPRPTLSPSDKAEFGLLAALLVFFGVVGAIVWQVVRAYRSPVVVAVDRPSKRAGEATVGTDKAKNAGPVRAVTIVPDSKAVAAVERLKRVEREEEDNLPPVRRPAPAPVEKAANYADELELDAQVLRQDSPEVEAAVALLSKYWKTRSWQEKLPLVFQPELVRGHMEEFYSARSSRDPEFGGFVSASEIRVSTRKIISLCYRSAGRLGGVLHADFHRTHAGLLLDWESLTGFSSRPMHDFRSAREESPTAFRVQAVRDDYYNFEFADEGKFLNFRLYTPDGDDYVHAYCERSGPIAKKLLQVLGDARVTVRDATAAAQAHESSPFPITVALAFPLHAQSDRCVRLERFISVWWLASDAEKPTTAAVAPLAR